MINCKNYNPFSWNCMHCKDLHDAVLLCAAEETEGEEEIDATVG